MKIKDVLIIKYNELTNKIKQYFDIDILPDLNEVDLVDVIYMINLSFPPDSNYKLCLESLLEMNNIKLNNNEFEEVYKIINGYLIWYRKLNI